jgi:SAM-dependent methyltransferase
MDALTFFRRVKYLFIIVFYEKPRGLDFHMPDWSVANSYNAGYSVTPGSFLKRVFKSKTLGSLIGKRLIDIGCGKGYVLFKLTKMFEGEGGYSSCAGIDIIPRLIEIAGKNMTAAGIKDKVSVEVADATKYDYDEYDDFFMYNPFPEVIMRQVVAKINESLTRRPRPIRIIYLHPYFDKVIREAGFKKIDSFWCREKRMELIIYSNLL